MRHNKAGPDRTGQDRTGKKKNKKLQIGIGGTR